MGFAQQPAARAPAPFHPLTSPQGKPDQQHKSSTRAHNSLTTRRENHRNTSKSHQTRPSSFILRVFRALFLQSWRFSSDLFFFSRLSRSHLPSSLPEAEGQLATVTAVPRLADFSLHKPGRTLLHKSRQAKHKRKKNQGGGVVRALFHMRSAHEGRITQHHRLARSTCRLAWELGLDRGSYPPSILFKSFASMR